MLEALDPDPEEMEWVSSTETICHEFYPSPAPNDDQDVPEAEAKPKPQIIPGAHVLHQTPLQRESGTMIDPGSDKGPVEHHFAGGTSISALWPTVKEEG